MTELAVHGGLSGGRPIIAATLWLNEMLLFSTRDFLT